MAGDTAWKGIGNNIAAAQIESAENSDRNNINRRFFESQSALKSRREKGAFEMGERNDDDFKNSLIAAATTKRLRVYN